MLSEFRPVIAFGDCTILATLLQLFFCTAVPVIMPTSSALMGVCRTLYHSSLLNISRAQHLIAESRPMSASVDCTSMAALLLHRCSSHHAHQLHKHTWCSNRYYASPIRFLQSQQSFLRTGSSVRFITCTMPWGAVHASSLHGGYTNLAFHLYDMNHRLLEAPSVFPMQLSASSVTSILP